MVLVLVCGGGNGAHVCAALAASHEGVTARVLTLFQDEAERWTNSMASGAVQLSVHRPGSQGTELVSGRPTVVTNEPAVAMADDVDVIVITVPSFAHEQYLTELKPYVKPGVVIVGMPGRAGFEFAVRSYWGEAAKHVSVINLESLPWACRISEFGKAADVLGVKDTLAGAEQVSPNNTGASPTEKLQKVLGDHPKLLTRGHLLGVTLSPTNGCIHPEILYGQWKDWDGAAVASPPLFYNGLSEDTAGLISAVSDEVMATAAAVMTRRPDVDLTNVEHIFQWYLRCYPVDIQDKTTLYTSIRTNKAYTGLVHPCTSTDDGLYVPNFQYRYLAEDLPYGLTVLRGIAQIVQLPTPRMDQVITWAQEKMGKSFLVDGVLNGKDINITRCPQRYGFHTLEDILG